MKPPRENATGKKNKYDVKHNSRQAKFPMRTIELSETVLQMTNQFYSEFDFLQMLFYLDMGMFAVVVVLRGIIPDLMNTNLTFYMTILTIIMYIANLGKGTFLMGFCGKLTDEAKVQLLAAVKTFILVFGLLTYTEGEVANAILNLDVVDAHD